MTPSAELRTITRQPRARNVSCRLTSSLFVLPLLLSFCARPGLAQTPGSTGPEVTRTFFLKNAVQQNDANEILTALRNMLDPRVKIFLVVSENAIGIHAAPDQIETVQQLISTLDRPRKTYRLTFTLTDVDSGQRVGTQHFSVVVTSGQRTTLKQGSKIPVATGTFTPGNASTQTQFTYLDVGMNFDVTLEDIGGNLRLKSKVEQSSLGQSSTIAGVQEPVVRQTVLEGASVLTSGKPLILGSIDISGSTRHTDIDVLAEPLP